MSNSVEVATPGTLGVASTARYRGDTRSPGYVPHTGSFYAELSKLFDGYPTAKTLEDQVRRFRRVLDRMPDAARRAGPSGVATLAAWAYHFDAARKIDGTPLHADAHFACLISRDVLAEQQSLTEFAANQTPESRAVLLRKSKKLHREVCELIAALTVSE